MPTASNKRIAKNTIFLYMRMLFIMVVSLYTSRVVLATLGEMDYGIQNVVGGFISVLAFLSNTVSSALSRYFAYEIGKGDKVRLNQYFVLSFIAFILIALVVIFFAETFGLWFIHNQMTIPSERMNAAFYVFHFSVLSFIVHMFIIPYNSLIIAEEKMNVYAYISIVEASLKLIIVYLLTIGEFDKLKLYAALLFCSSLLSQSLYVIYASTKFKIETKIHFFWDKSMFKSLMSYSGWTLFGALADICKGQGLNILLNIFFTPVVNAARGIAYQVNNAINQFVTGFYTACRPQITKLYAQNEQEGMMNLVFRTSRLCYFLIITLSLPILVEIDPILHMWLGNYPEYTAIFTRLVIINAIIDSLSYPFQTAVSATGNIKWYQIVTGGLLVLILPVSYMFLKLGCPPQITMVVCIGIALIAQVFRMFFMKQLHKMSFRAYLDDVLVRVILVTISSLAIVLTLDRFFDCNRLIELVVFIGTSVLVICVFIYTLGISKSERHILNDWLFFTFIKKRQLRHDYESIRKNT